ncbi:hypothetical protein B0H10DRAFT_2057600 [Mycena sp. CBHHK59/15]|nr:hypothetical protein B0H10DRAFT_2057600 [Mycena sp. CBHHK59/15]
MFSLPHTSNTLPRAERIRLVRSTRKLQALLGETPQVVEAATSLTQRPLIRSNSTSASGSSFSARRSHRNLPPSTLTLIEPDSCRPHLLLHFKSASSPNAHKHTHSLPSTPVSPLSPTYSITLNNVSLSTPRAISIGRSTTLKDIRRRRMAKLARTLGENVPLELITESSLPPERNLYRTASIVGFSRSSTDPVLLTAKSSHTVRTNVIFASPPSALNGEGYPMSPKSPTLGRSYSTSSASPRSPRIGVIRYPRGESVAFASADFLAAKEARDTAATRLENAVEKLNLELKSGRRRKEKDWSGEWNTEMDAVAKQLRALKT